MFQTRTDGVVGTATKFTPRKDCVIEEFEEFETVHVNPKAVLDENGRTNDFIKWKEIRKKSSKSLNDYIKSFDDEVGILNILKKIQMSGDSLPNNPIITDKIDDFSRVPESFDDAYDALVSGETAWKNLPDELKAGQSRDDFVKNFTKEKFDSYINSLIDKAMAANKIDKKKEGE